MSNKVRVFRTFSDENQRQVQARLFHDMGVTPTAMERFQPTLQADETEEEEENVIEIYGVIVPHEDLTFYRYWYGDESVVSAKLFRDKIAKMEGDVLVRINSPGGDAFECSSIVNCIDERGGVNAMVDGLAASSAGIIMCACSHVEIARMGQVMIHKAHGWAYGTAKQHENLAKTLRGIDGAQASIIGKRMDKTSKQVLALLDDETWFAASEAVETGLADEIVEPKGDGGEDNDNPEAKAENAVVLARKREREHVNALAGIIAIT